MHHDKFNLLNDCKKKLLFKIRYMYGLNENAHEFLNSYFDLKNENDSDKLQEILVDFVLTNKYLLQYGPYFKYKKSFLKTVIDIVESSNNEVKECLFNDYINLINHERNENETDTKKYFLVVFSKFDNYIDDRPIIIEQYASIIANGTTGLHVWPACFQLMEYFYENEHLIENKSILELGSGVGLLGFMCLKFKQLKSFKFSDSHSLVLKQIENNLNLNRNESLVFDNDIKAISIEKIDWTDLENDCLNYNETFDLIVATDIIFDPELIPYLMKTLNHIWNVTNNAQNLCFYVSSTIRNPSTYELFINSLNQNNFVFESMQKKSPIAKSSTPECLIEILKITKN